MEILGIVIVLGVIGGAIWLNRKNKDSSRGGSSNNGGKRKSPGFRE